MQELLLLVELEGGIEPYYAATEEDAWACSHYLLNKYDKDPLHFWRKVHVQTVEAKGKKVTWPKKG